MECVRDLILHAYVTNLSAFLDALSHLRVSIGVSRTLVKGRGEIWVRSLQNNFGPHPSSSRSSEGWASGPRIVPPGYATASKPKSINMNAVRYQFSGNRQACLGSYKRLCKVKAASHLSHS